MAHFTSIGKSVPKIEGSDKVSGGAAYTADQILPGMIWGKSLRSPYPHARIVAIETRRAQAHPGVLAVLTAQDLPDRLGGRRLRDMPVLARDRVRFIGEKVAVVAAEDPNVAEEALELIAVEYEELPAVFEPLEAVEGDAPLLHERMSTYKGLPEPLPDLPNVYSYERWNLGDVEAGFKESDHVFEHTFRTQYVHQGYLEPHAGVVALGEDGRVHIWAANKVPYDVKEQFAEAVDLPPERLVVHVTPIGGDFGGKGALMDVPLCYYLAKRTRRPVKMVMSYAEELMAANPRHPSVMTMKTGVKKDGTLVARQVTIHWNGGAYGAMKPIPSVNLPGAVRAAGCYRIPNVKIDSYAAYTNCVPCGHFRAPGQAQLVFAGESQMDIMAEALGLDPLEFRLRNGIRDGDLTPDHRSMTHVKCNEVLHAVAKASSWSKPKPRRNVGRGIAVSHRNIGAGDANARLTLLPDGTVSLLTTYPDTGTGSHTILCQIVAETLGVPFEQVKLKVGTTDHFRSESGTGASRVTYVMGKAAESAASKLKAEILQKASRILLCSAEEITLRSGRCVCPGRPSQSLSLGQLASAAADRGDRIEVETYFEATEIPDDGVFSAMVAEVEVDDETGQLRVLNLTTAHDVGTVLNPVNHQGQIEGGLVQGLGFALMEEMIVENGRTLTLNLGEYKLPNIVDLPKLKTVLVEEEVGVAPFQSKEIGESAISQVAPAIANAVYDAVGVRIMDLPLTAERVLSALRAGRGG